MAKFRVNGRQVEASGPDDAPLLWVLRDELGLTGTKFGCGVGQCGACTVHVGGQAVRSCLTPVSAVDSQPITTLAGIGRDGAPHPVQQAFMEKWAAQCGYCLNGWIMTAVALLEANPQPTDSEIRSAFSGLKCRCESWRHKRTARPWVV